MKNKFCKKSMDKSSKNAKITQYFVSDIEKQV